MKQANKQGNKNKIGAIGEQIAENYLKKRGYNILSINYLKKWGEIDIVTHETTKKIHFVEVKTISHETVEKLRSFEKQKVWRPEENVTREKIARLHRTIESWLEEYEEYSICDWQLDVIAIRVVPHEKYATVKYIDNVIL